MDRFKIIRDAIIDGKEDAVIKSIEESIKAGITAYEIIQYAFIAVVTIIDTKMQKKELLLPEAIIAIKTMQKGFEILKPLLEDEEVETLKINLGNITGDLNSIDKELINYISNKEEMSRIKS